MTKKILSPPNNIKVGVISLGCPKNLVDTEKMLGRFLASGYQVTSDPQKADLLLVNTCGFIADAREESMAAIQEMAKLTRQGQKKGKGPQRLVVTGCLAQRDPEALLASFPEIDLLLGSSQYHELLPMIEQLARKKEKQPQNKINRVHNPLFHIDEPTERLLTTPPHLAYLKIAEGCDNPCAFCIIPALRGPYCSRPMPQIVEEAQQLADQGVKEIILISQDTTLYGRDLHPRLSLTQLLQQLEKIDNLQWIRLLYLYPTLIQDSLLDTIANSQKIVEYFDLPLQHSHSNVLARMQRAERTEKLTHLIERIRQKIPSASLRATFIVGFPGETEEEFLHLVAFIQHHRFDHVGVFTYSDEEGTPAFTMPNKIAPKIANQRRDHLLQIQQKISQEKLQSFIDQTVSVLVDGIAAESELLLVGRLRGQAPDIDGLVYINQGTAQAGQIVQVTITETHEYDLVGSVISTS